MDELKAALELIERTCKKNRDCSDCPLYFTGGYAREGMPCFLRSHVPSLWKIGEWEKWQELIKEQEEDEEETDGDSP